MPDKKNNIEDRRVWDVYEDLMIELDYFPVSQPARHYFDELGEYIENDKQCEIGSDYTTQANIVAVVFMLAILGIGVLIGTWL